MSEREGYEPWTRQFTGRGKMHRAYTILRGRIVDACPHKHRSHRAAATCAEAMCAVRNESYFGKTKEASK